MKMFIFYIVLILLASLIPIIPYDVERGDGITVIENKSIYIYLTEQYKIQQGDAK